MESTRSKWTDERMDDFAKRTDENFKEVRADIRGLRGQIQGAEKGLRIEMNARFAQLEGKIEQRFNILFGALATGFVAAVVQHFLG